MGEKKSVCQLMLLLLLVFAPQESLVRTVAARTRLCESQSHLFSGQCWSDRNCGQVCKNEGFYGGKCRGFRKRCFCTKPCAPPHD